eukprot:scaffold7210_cov174-Skeletonema_menzelii.AAC.1
MSTGAEAGHPQALPAYSALQHEKSPVHVPAATAVRLRENRQEKQGNQINFAQLYIATIVTVSHLVYCHSMLFLQGCIQWRTKLVSDDKDSAKMTMDRIQPSREWWFGLLHVTYQARSPTVA